MSLPPRTLRSALLAVAAALVAPVLASESGGAPGPVPGGARAAAPPAPRMLERWQHDRPATGFDLYQGTVSGRSGVDQWTVTVRGSKGGGGVSADPDDPTGPDLQSRADAEALAERLWKAGFTPRTEEISWPEGTDRTGVLGVRVRVGAYGSKGAADGKRKAITEAGFPAVTEWTGADGTPGTGKARLRVAIVDPQRFRGSLDASYGRGVSGREKVSGMAAGSLLGVNAGFFAMTAEDGVPGAPTGVGVYDGELESAATNGRIAAVLRGGDGLGVELVRLTTKLHVRDGSATETVDGVNRTPGKISNCGGVGGDAPTEWPQHDVTCTDPDEIVRFTENLGSKTPEGDGVEAVLNGKGSVVAVRRQGGTVPEGGSVLAGIGKGASWLRAHASKGKRLTVDEHIVDEKGREMKLGPEDDIVNGGPQLVRAGMVAVTVGADGIDSAEDRSSTYAWAVKRNPRTLLGTDEAGRVLVVTADGRRPGYSDGLELTEAARLMVVLGAVDAMNLDGGGSTAMTLNGKLINRPSDPGGERSVGDALLLKQPWTARAARRVPVRGVSPGWADVVPVTKGQALTGPGEVAPSWPPSAAQLPVGPEGQRLPVDL